MWLQRFVLRRLATMILILEARMAEQEGCKHEGQTGVYCGKCGKQLEADPEVATALERTLTRVLKENYGLEPKAKKKEDDPPSSSLSDKIFGSKKKKEEKK